MLLAFYINKKNKKSSCFIHQNEYLIENENYLKSKNGVAIHFEWIVGTVAILAQGNHRGNASAALPFLRGFDSQ